MTQQLPRQYVMDTLSRAQQLPLDDFGAAAGAATVDAAHAAEQLKGNAVDVADGGDADELDDFYGHTSEVITFAEKG